MIRSLFVAALTFVSLGTYYRAADETVRDRSVGSSRAELIRIARSSALFGANRMKESLAEKWIDQRAAGGYAGGRYRTVAVLKRSRGIVRAVGLAPREGGEELTYSVRMDVFRRMRSLADASTGYDVIMRASTTDVETNELQYFVESSQ